MWQTDDPKYLFRCDVKEWVSLTQTTRILFSPGGTLGGFTLNLYLKKRSFYYKCKKKRLVYNTKLVKPKSRFCQKKNTKWHSFNNNSYLMTWGCKGPGLFKMSSQASVGCKDIGWTVIGSNSDIIISDYFTFCLFWQFCSSSCICFLNFGHSFL